MTDIAFDEERHEYSLRGVRIPHVTGILADLCDFSHVAPSALEYARLRGTATHKAVELYHSERGLAFDLLSPPILARMLQYEAFIDRTGFEAILVERVIFHPLLGYAGKLDLFGTFPPKCGGPRTHALIDIKTGVVEPVAGPQTAAYQRALALEYPHAALAERFALWLGETRYSLVPLTDSTDWAQFHNRLITWKTREVLTAMPPILTAS